MYNYPSEKRDFYGKPEAQNQQPVEYPPPPASQNQGYGYPQFNEQQMMPQPIQANTIVINQQVPNIVFTNISKIGTSPFSTTCQYCRTLIKTNVEKTCNCCVCLMCCYTGFIIFAIIQLCSGKEVCCCDAVHKCPNCGRILATYSAN